MESKANQAFKGRTRYVLPFVIFSTIAFAACEKEDNNNPSNNPGNNNDTTNADTTNPDTTNPDTTEPEKNPILKRSFSGDVQKGPFVGGEVKIYNLPDSTNLRYNGNFHKANIGPNGEYSLSPKATAFIRTVAKGQYFNEVKGQVEDELKMESVTKAPDTVVKSSVNTVGDVVFSRIDDQMAISSFNQARDQAVTNLANELEADPSKFSTKKYSNFDLTKQGYENALLLAFSSITQGQRGPNKLESLLRDTENDFAQNGQLSKELGNKLVTSAYYLRKPDNSSNGYSYDYISQNLKDQISNANPDSRYKTIMKDFINNSPYSFNTKEMYDTSDLIKVQGAEQDNLVGLAINGPDTINAWYTTVALAAKVPAGENLTVEAINKVPSGSRLKLFGSGWEETQKDKYVAKSQFPRREDYQTSRIASFGEYATFEVSGSLLPKKDTVVIDF